MLQPLSADECREFRESMGRSIHGAVSEAARVEDPAELELLGAELIPPGLLAGTPGMAAELVAMIGEAKGGLSLLRAMSAAAPPPVSTLAADAAARLGQSGRPAVVNGAAGLVIVPGARPVAVVGFTIAEGRIVEIDLIADPEKLRTVVEIH